jgi:polyferredoxin
MKCFGIDKEQTEDQDGDDSESCNQCHLFTRNCPMSLPVEEMVKIGEMENPECILCGTCAYTF